PENFMLGAAAEQEAHFKRGRRSAESDQSLPTSAATSVDVSFRARTIRTLRLGFELSEGVIDESAGLGFRRCRRGRRFDLDWLRPIVVFWPALAGGWRGALGGVRVPGPLAAGQRADHHVDIAPGQFRLEVGVAIRRDFLHELV